MTSEDICGAAAQDGSALLRLGSAALALLLWGPAVLFVGQDLARRANSLKALGEVKSRLRLPKLLVTRDPFAVHEWVKKVRRQLGRLARTGQGHAA